MLSSTSGTDGIVFMTALQFRAAFEAIDSSRNLSAWTRSYFLVLDDKLDSPGVLPEGGPTFTRHEFTIRSQVNQSLILSVNVHNDEIYPRREGCADAFNDSPLNAKYVVDSPDFLAGPEVNTVGGKPNFWLKDGGTLFLRSNRDYRVYVELWGDNPRVARDFSIVALTS